MTLAAVTIWLVWAALSAFVLVVDPYDVRPWGARSVLPGAFQPFEMDRLVRLAASDPEADLVLIGSSPTTPYTPDALRRVWPEARRPWNVSLHGGWAEDRFLTLNEFADRSNATHYLITVDFFLAARTPRARPTFPFFLYDRTPVNDLRVLTPRAVADALRVLREGTPYPDGAAVERQEAEFNATLRDHHRLPYFRDLLDTAVRDGQAAMRRRSDATCADLPGVTAFMAGVGRLRARGARVDLLIPIYSSAVYYEWAQDPDRRRELGPAPLEDQLLMRRCVVVAAQAMGVAVHAADDDARLVNDLRNFRDPGHLSGEANLAAFIALPRDPTTRLTPDNFDAYAARVRANVLAFRPGRDW